MAHLVIFFSAKVNFKDNVNVLLDFKNSCNQIIACPRALGAWIVDIAAFQSKTEQEGNRWVRERRPFSLSTLELLWQSDKKEGGKEGGVL